MKRINLIRLEESKDGCIGVLLIDNKIVCYALENGLDEKFRILEGIYTVFKYKSPTYGDTYEIKVPGHKYVLFHWGNFETNTEGCILTGTETGTLYNKETDYHVRSVLDSRKAFKKFMGFMGGEEKAELVIDNFNYILNL